MENKEVTEDAIQALVFLDFKTFTTKAFDYVDHNKLWKILKRDENTRSPDLLPEISVCSSGSNS